MNFFSNIAMLKKVLTKTNITKQKKKELPTYYIE